MRNGAKLKRAFDIVVAGIGLILLLPLIAAVAILVRINLGRPILFRQERPGRFAKPFTLFKFRTMRQTRWQERSPLPDAQRLSPFGKYLRATSLDELPELWNVVRGDMSLVGPRPLLMEYVPLYTDQQARRHEVRPGLTGWAQVNGRNALSWADRFELDVWYIDHWSMWLDLKILGMTARDVLKRTGISADGEATMSRFTGTKSE